MNYTKIFSVQVLSRHLRYQVLIPIQQLHATVRFSSSYSSSSDSSDSDSDTESKKQEPLATKNMPQDNTNKAINLESILNQMLKGPKTKKSYEGLQPKKKSITGSSKSIKQKSYTEELTKAAEDVASTLKGDKAENLSQLLDKLSKTKQKTGAGQDESTSVNLQGIVSGMSVEKVQGRHMPARKSLPRRQSSPSGPSSKATEKFDNLWDKKDSLSIFKDVTKSDVTKETPQLSTWDLLQESQLKILTTTSPRNAFQEMIQWTEQGMMWKFPVDNEQGMEAEQNVHFSEHVFMERHLQGWCPKRGPIRHFMELVCVGLSKNPYMTAEEKRETIIWYKDYFGSKEALLKEIGAIENPINVPAKEIEA